jgi:copper transport protein
MTGRCRLAVAATILSVVAMTPDVVHAHAELIDSDPAPGAVLDVAPDRIVLRFTEAVDPVDDAIRLLASNGSSLELVDVGQSEGDDSMTATIPSALPDGSYVIAWSALSADSHPISGAVPFSIGEPSADTTALADELAARDDEPVYNELLVAGGRLASYVGALVLIGIAGVVSLVLPALLAERRTATWLLAGSLVGAGGTAAMLAGQSHRISGSFVDWSAVVSTHAGLWWALRLVVFVAAMLVIPEVRRLDTAAARVLGLLTTIVVFTVVALGGHAISGAQQPIGLTATVVHLGAAAAWIGALLLLTVLAPRDERWEIAPRISLIALTAVVALAVTGGFNGWRQLSGVHDLVDTGYGRLLGVKLILIAVVLGFAASSRRTVHTAPQARGPATATDRGDAADEVIARSAALQRTVLVEVAGIALILVVTVALSTAVPPRSLAVSALGGTSEGVELTSTAQDDLVAALEVVPAKTGENSLTVELASVSDETVVADEITVEIALPEADVGPIDVEADLDGPNRVSSTSTVFPTSGRWTVTVTARFGEFDQTVFRFEVDITDR